jgi:hypothetical protein
LRDEKIVARDAMGGAGSVEAGFVAVFMAAIS